MKHFTSLNTVSALAFAAIIGIGGFAVLSGGPAGMDSAQAAEAGTPVSPGLVIPPMDPVKGKALFASKGCVVCHSVNGVGGTDAPEIDAAAMSPQMSPFDFFAKMWNHAQGMIAMQQDEIGGQITFENGQQLADIIAFLHDAKVQKTFTEDDIPADVKAHLDDDGEGGSMTMNRGTMMDHDNSMMNGGSRMGN